MKKIIISLFILSILQTSKGQGCVWSPADCPDQASIENSTDSLTRLENGILPAEISMQNSMRYLVTQMMEKAGRNLHWQWTELDELTNLDPLQGAATPYNVRSPRGFGIAFEFFVSKDSLQAWKNWTRNFNERYDNVGKAAFQQDNYIQNSSQYRQYYDSVQRYTKLYTSYITTHSNISASDDKRAKYLLKKQNDFIDKMNYMREHPSNSSGETLDDLEKEKKLKMLQFKENSVLQVFFDFNPNVGLINTSSPVTIKNWNVPGAKIAKSVHLSNPELNTLLWHFENSSDMKVLLLGNWLSKPSDENYSATFTLNGQGDEQTPKKIKSDKVQTIAIHLLGNDQNISKIMPFIDITELNKVIVKN
ncbi:MAG: hypothetical protein ACTHNG_13825 [Ginsengibacter sp.]